MKLTNYGSLSARVLSPYLSKILILLGFVCLAQSGISQVLKGTVKSTDGETIPFASIYIKELTTGTTTNLEGEYSIQLEPGNYHIYFQALGFQRIELLVNMKQEEIEKEITLQTQDYRIKEVRVYSGQEDPAYAIMRKSISLAPYFLRQIKHYKANVYLKGGFDMNKIPRMFRKQLREDEGIEQGKTYVAESVNEIKFDAPNKYEHMQISKRSTFPNDNEEEVLEFINYSFYDSDSELAISPVSRKAFSFYKYRYEGFFQQGEFYVNKIKVTPKRKNQKLFEGYIYIVDQLWNIHSVDLTNEQFFGKIKVHQVQEPVKGKAWLPVSHQFEVDIKIMGFKVKGNYGGSVKYSDVELDETLPVPASLKKAYFEIEEQKKIEEAMQLTKNQKKIEALLEKEEMNNREMLKLARLMEKENKERETEGQGLEVQGPRSNYKVVKDTVKKRKVDWTQMRSIPLSEKELKSFEVKDSIKLAKSGKVKNDTINKKQKSQLGKVLGNIMGGKRYYVGDSAWAIRHDGLIDTDVFSFNAVDGITYKQYFHVYKKIDTLHTINIRPSFKYAFSRKQFMWRVHNNYTLWGLKRGYVYLNAGQWAHDFNNYNGIAPFVNMVSSLIFKENYMKLYQDNYANAGMALDIANGLRFTGFANYQYLERLENTTNYSFGDRDRLYRPNNEVENQAMEAFDSKHSFNISATVEYTPRQYYRIVKGRKRSLHSKYPTMSLVYKGGYDGVFDSDSRFDMMEFSVRQKLEWSYMYELNYSFKSGYFLNNDNMHFSQYKHFNTSEVPISFKNWKSNFNLLNDYEYSTNRWYVEGHLAFSTPYLLIKNLPFLQDKLWNENLYYHHLTQPEFKNYNEIGYGISQIFLMMNVGVFAGFEDFEYARWGARLSFKFDL